MVCIINIILTSGEICAINREWAKVIVERHIRSIIQCHANMGVNEGKYLVQKPDWQTLMLDERCH